LLLLIENKYNLYLTQRISDNSELPEILRREGITFLPGGQSSYDFVVSTSGKEDSAVFIRKGSDFLSEIKSEISPSRTAEISRDTKETSINCVLNLDGSGKAEIKTGIGFFDHMLEQIARHGNIDLSLKIEGDLNVDEHHTVEDAGIVFGETLLKALGDKSGIKRYGFLLPMDDCIAKAAIDLGGRPFLNFKVKFEREKIGEFPTELTEEFFRAVSISMKSNIYIRAKGKNEHHKIESIFKAFAKALNEALRIDERNKSGLPSTKGVL
jgi:imidazoleglycerol-phosphate dehydratase/histidinol-phosphatase